MRNSGFIDGPYNLGSASTAGDCYIGDPSDSTHSGRSKWCRKCKNVVCAGHPVEVDGQRFCVRCWESGRPIRELSD